MISARVAERLPLWLRAPVDNGKLIEFKLGLDEVAELGDDVLKLFRISLGDAFDALYGSRQTGWFGWSTREPIAMLDIKLLVHAPFAKVSGVVSKCGGMWCVGNRVLDPVEYFYLYTTDPETLESIPRTPRNTVVIPGKNVEVPVEQLRREVDYSFCTTEYSGDGSGAPEDRVEHARSVYWSLAKAVVLATMETPGPLNTYYAQASVARDLIGVKLWVYKDRYSLHLDYMSGETLNIYIRVSIPSSSMMKVLDEQPPTTRTISLRDTDALNPELVASTVIEMYTEIASSMESAIVEKLRSTALPSNLLEMVARGDGTTLAFLHHALRHTVVAEPIRLLAMLRGATRVELESPLEALAKLYAMGRVELTSNDTVLLNGVPVCKLYSLHREVRDLVKLLVKTSRNITRGSKAVELKQ